MTDGILWILAGIFGLLMWLLTEAMLWWQRRDLRKARAKRKRDNEKWLRKWLPIIAKQKKDGRLNKKHQ